MKLALKKNSTLSVIAFFTISINSACGSSIYFSEVGLTDIIAKVTPAPNISNAKTTNILSLRNRDPRGIAVDNVNNKIYFADGVNISSANLDGSDKKTIIAVGKTPGDIEVDSANNRLYYSTLFGGGNGIYSAKTDGSDIRTIHDISSLALTNPLDKNISTNRIRDLSIDTTNNLLYWVNANNSGQTSLNSSMLTGGKAVHHWLSTNRTDAINKMEIDFETSTLFYTVDKKVKSSTLDNKNIKTIFSGTKRTQAIALDNTNDKLFFNIEGTLYEMNKDGSSLISRNIGSSNYNIGDMEFVTSEVPLPAAAWLFGSALIGLAFTRKNKSI